MANSIAIRTADADRHTKPSLKPALQWLVDLGVEPKMIDRKMMLVMRNQWEPPADQAPALAAELRTAVSAYDRYMAPASTGRISARITVTLAHFYVPDVPEALQRAILTDWIEALAAFPFWAIDEACVAWLRRESRKPTIADIAKLARETVEPERSAHRALRAALAQCTGTLAEFTDYRPRREREGIGPG